MKNCEQTPRPWDPLEEAPWGHRRLREEGTAEGLQSGRRRRALRGTQLPLQLLPLGTEKAPFSSSPHKAVSLFFCFWNDNAVVATVTPSRNRGSLRLRTNSSPKVGDFQITTQLRINLLFSLLQYACQKQTRQLLFKGEKEIKIDLKRSSPAWDLDFCANPEQWPTTT